MRWAATVAAAVAVLLSSVGLEAVAAAAAECGAAACEGPDGWEMAEAESEQMQAELVQARAQILKSRGSRMSAGQLARGVPPTPSIASMLRAKEGTELSAEQRASLIVPIAWLHVPKTGSSILNTFYHTPTICPTFLADNYMIKDAQGQTNYWNYSFWGTFEVVCAGGFSQTYGFASPWYAHHGFEHAGIGGFKGAMYQLNRGHLVAMLRQPEQRLISQYYHHGPLLLMNGSDMVWPFESVSPSLREYAEWNQGCTVRQLTTDADRPFGHLPLPTSQDVSEAIDVLRDGFIFVGITEEWALSVCLFRAMFGGECLSSDLMDARPGDYSNSSGYDTSELYGWVDVWDGALYAEARSMFDATSNMYGVDSEWCTSFCQDQFDEVR
jgi:hypothetical protein